MVQAIVHVKWIEGGLFTGIDSRGTPLTIGKSAGHEPAWLGVKASDLLLLGVAGCSGHDVAEILHKQRQAITSLEINVTGEQDADPPWKFNTIAIEYVIRGRQLNETLIQRAIDLSENKYCSVLATVRPGAQIKTQYRIEEA